MKYCLWIGLLCWATGVGAQALPCGSDDMYMIVTPSITKNSELYKITRDTLNEEAIFTKIADLDRQIDAAGYRVTDGFIYGIERSSKSLIRVDGLGNTTLLGHPLLLDTTYQFYAGTITPSGRSLYVIGRNPHTGFDEKIFQINLNSPDYITGVSSLLADGYVQIGDIGFDPVYGTVFGFDALGKRLVNVRTSGQVSWFGFLNTPLSVGLGSVVFDREGRLYGYGYPASGSVESTLFEINKFNGKLTIIDKGPGERWTDGCACPYYVAMSKQVSPAAVVPCGEVRIVYRFDNQGGTSYSAEFISDTLPPDLRIVGIDRLNFSYDSIAGIGTNVLYIHRPALYLGTDSVVIRAVVDENALGGTFASHAWLGTLPRMLGEVIRSDDPRTSVEQDATEISILPADAWSLSLAQTILCPGDTLTLRAPGGGQGYLWSDGSRGQELLISQGGTYWLELENACGVFRDTFEIEGRTQLLSLDLGPDQEIVPGDSLVLPLQYQGAAGALEYHWQMSPLSYLSCEGCAQPVLLPQQDSRVGLRIRDQEGCEAYDEMFVRLQKIRKIYAPTAFSPNGDQLNDLFYLQGFGEVELVEMRVFNRWGNLVFVRQGGWINDIRHSWDGNSQGQPVAPGVYMWSVQLLFPDGEQQTFSGSLTLIR